jgi:EAL domain-containing protein (putative c-di-GMP-specific phosphodiesterase class I)
MAVQDQGEDPDDVQARFSRPSESALPRISIDEALQNDWLEIWYQPKIDLRRKCLAGAEVIVRMQDPQAGFLWPEEYIDRLDDDGLKKLFEHTMLTTLRHWTVFSDAGFNLRLAVNVPAVLLPQLPISLLVSEHRPTSDNWPGIVLGVTEDQLVRDIALTRKIAEDLKACGVAVAIDDFGAGYSSLSSLRGLPFAELKIHSSFIKNCATDLTNAAICQTAIDLAHRFGSLAVAKGIETIADLQALMVMGCDFGQGALVAPAMRKSSFLDALRQHMNKPATPDRVRNNNAENVA